MIPQGLIRFGGAAGRVGLLFVAVSMASTAAADPAAASSCPAEYAGGRVPVISNPKLSDRLRELCFRQFAVHHSGVTATPLFVSQRLTADMVRQAKAVDREDVFHEEDRLPETERASLAHYRKSGYDRGHMAPAADMATKGAQDDSFSLANMVPQLPELNRRSWAEVEETARNLALSYGEVFLVTGPAFAGDKLTAIGGRVIVPTHVYKAVFIPSTGQASAWWADNSTGRMEVVSVAELAERIGADVFPAASQSVKQSGVALPLPRQVGTAPRKPDGGVVGDGGGSWKDAVVAFLVGFLENLLRAIWRAVA